MTLEEIIQDYDDVPLTLIYYHRYTFVFTGSFFLCVCAQPHVENIYRCSVISPTKLSEIHKELIITGVWLGDRNIYMAEEGATVD